MVDVYELVCEFYIIKQIEADMEIDEFKKSHANWENKFNTYKHDFINVFHQMIFDYTMLACAGELRHAKTCSNKSHPDIPSACSRGVAMVTAKTFTQESLEKCMLDLFGPMNEWKNGYGGEAWYKIASVLPMASKLPKDVWLDHCVDLAHNNGSYFNKTSANIFHYNYSSDLQSFLDWKRNGVVWDYKRLSCSSFLSAIVLQAQQLKIIPDFNLYINKHNTSLLVPALFVRIVTAYIPIKWGQKELHNNYQEAQIIQTDKREDFRYDSEER